jgi:hypothetical protein
MSFTYAELKQALQDYLETSETTFVNNLPRFIKIAEERILKNVQLTLFRKNVTGTLSASNQYLASPSDFLAPFSLSYTNADGQKIFLQFKNVSFVQEYNLDPTETGPPRYYAQFDNENFIVGPTPDSSYPVELHYMYRPQSLTAGPEGGTTWLSENAELLLFYGALVEAYMFLKGDPDLMGVYQQRFEEALLGMKMLGEAKQTTDEYRTGSVIRIKQ